jgi:hypothetical protein
MPWEETEEYIRHQNRDPTEFQKETLRTITLSEKDGIKAVIGKPNGKHVMEIISYLFERSKGWTVEKAKEWLQKHQDSNKEHVYALLPFTVNEKVLEKPLRIRGVAMTAGMSRNFNIYTPEELQAFAGKLVDAPVYVEHVTAADAVGKVTNSNWDGENLWYEAEIYDEETADKIRKGLIRHISVGADYETVDLVAGRVPHGLNNAEISLVAVPGIPSANIQVMEKLHAEEQGLEPIVAGEFVLGFYQDPSAFLPEHFTTVWLDRENGILSFMGKLREQPDVQRTQAILFSKTKMWDQTKIRDWLQLHPSYMAPVSGQTFFSERLFRKTTEPAIPISKAVRLIEAVLPSPIVQRSWSLGPQRMCQELRRVILRLRGLQDGHSCDRE